MAVKVECDGCDKHLGSDVNAHRVRVTVQKLGADQPIADAQYYDLCPYCLERLQENANPTRRTRAAPKKPRCK